MSIFVSATEVTFFGGMIDEYECGAGVIPAEFADGVHVEAGAGNAIDEDKIVL